MRSLEIRPLAWLFDSVHGSFIFKKKLYILALRKSIAIMFLLGLFPFSSVFRDPATLPEPDERRACRRRFHSEGGLTYNTFIIRFGETVFSDSLRGVEFT